MKTEVFAVVLSHDQPELLAKVLENLSKQTVQPNKVLIVDTSKNSTSETHGFESIKLPPNTTFSKSVDEAFQRATNEDFLWLLHDDSIPFPDALEKLLREVELSPSLALVGPKQLDLENSKIIKQLGLTLTRSWRLLGKVKDEFDQGQHDTSQDILAVGTAGALIRLSAFRELSGFDAKAPVLASDVDFSIRARLSGHRVAVAPDAKISHAMLSLQGKRSLTWLGSPVAVALRRAELHLMLSYLNPFAFLAIWLFLLPLAIFNSAWMLFIKRGRAIPAELAAALLTFLSLPSVINSRSKIRKTTRQGFRTLAPLLATRAEVKRANRRSRELALSHQLIKAHAAGVETNQGSSGKSLWWWTLAIALLNIFWIPTNVAATGNGMIPLGSNWLEIFSNAGATAISSGLGVQSPSDPWHWVLALVSAPTFFAPSMALTIIFFLSTAISFLGTYQLTETVTSKNYARLISSAGFALWPALTISIQETRISQVIALATLPWLLLSLAKILRLGHFASRENISTWSQVGLSAILFALVSASSPSLGLVMLIGLLVFALIRPKQLLPALFVPGLAVAWWLPLVVKNLNFESLPSLLLDPGVLLPNQLGQNLIFFGYQFDAINQASLLVFPVAALVVFALLSLLKGKISSSIALWVIAAIGFTAALVIGGVSFDFGAGPVGVSPLASLGLFGLALWLLAAHLMEHSQMLSVIAAWVLVLLAVVPSATYLVISPPDVKYSDGRIVPSIIQAEANAGSNQNTLKLTEKDGLVIAELFSGDGLKLEDLTTRYSFLLSDASSSSEYLQLGQLVANLVSANGALLSEDLVQLNIGYVLVSPKNAELKLALDSTNELESIGDTDFGQLWKVRELSLITSEKPFDFGFAKISQLALLGFYLVLAVPTRSARRRRTQTSEIFKDVEENN